MWGSTYLLKKSIRTGSKDKLTLRVCGSVFRVGLLAVMMTPILSDAATPSWGSSNPSWANGSPSSGRPNSSYRGDSDYRQPTSPFAPGSHNLAIDVGQVFLMGDLAEQYADNIGFKLHYDYGVSDIFAFDSSLGYSNHSEGAFSMTSLQTGLRANLSWFDKIIPHVLFGLGFYRPSYQIGETQSLSPILFGLHFGGGVNLQITRQFFFGANLTIHDIFNAERTVAGQKMDVGGSFASFLLQAGTTF